jgi:hypothetical protein
LDFDETHFLFDLQVSYGVSDRIEIEAFLPYEIDGQADGDDGDFEFEARTVGLGDLTIGANYLILRPLDGAPQVTGGLVIVLPTGDSELGVAEIQSGGTVTQEGEEGGIGDGVLKVGFQAGIQAPLESGVVYAELRYVFPMGTDNGDDVEIDRADEFTATAGMMLPLGSSSNIDLRWTLAARGDEVADFDATGESTEESHLSFQFESRFYFKANRTTHLFGALGLGWIGDHAADEEDDAEIKDVYGWGITFGLQVKLSGREPVEF